MEGVPPFTFNPLKQTTMKTTYTATVTFNLRDPRTGRIATYTKGQVITQAKFNALPTKGMQDRFVAQVKERVARAKVEKLGHKVVGTRTPWTTEENELAILLYLDYFTPEGGAMNNREAVSAFQEFFPDRSYSSVNMKFAQIRGLDNWDPNFGLASSSEVQDMLLAVDPDRFAA
jgi:hypothetical protein